MKNIGYLFFSMGFLLAISCQQEGNNSIQNCCLSSADSLSIINEIIVATNNYAIANINMDFDKAANFYDSSSDFKLAENGEEYANWDSLYLTIKNAFQPLDSVNCIWGERNVIPLKPDAATLYSGLSFRT
ncbi:MAG: hypothetical protein ABFS32_23725 [Bacteroidota bacterium]